MIHTFTTVHLVVGVVLVLLGGVGIGMLIGSRAAIARRLR